VLKRLREVEAEWPHALTTVYGPGTSILYASANHLESGWTEADMIGSHWTKFVPASEFLLGELVLEDALLNGESAEVGVVGLTKHGQKVRMKVRAWKIEVPESGETFVLVRSLLVDKPASPGK
jgi:hypothetical protein